MENDKPVRTYTRRNPVAPKGAYAIKEALVRGRYTMYSVNMPRELAGPIHDAGLCAMFEIVEDGILMRLVPALDSVPEPTTTRKAAEELAARFANTDGKEG